MNNDLVKVLDDLDQYAPNIINTSHYTDDPSTLFTPDKPGNVLMSINIQSLPSKLDNLKILLDNLESNSNINIPILNLQETWLDELQETSIYFQNFNIEYKHKINGKIGGGLAILIRKNLNYTVRKDISFPQDKQHIYDSLFIEIKLPNRIQSANRKYIPLS